MNPRASFRGDKRKKSAGLVGAGFETRPYMKPRSVRQPFTGVLTVGAGFQTRPYMSRGAGVMAAHTRSDLNVDGAGQARPTA